ncbi:BON domain-containing protein [Chamaesiphon polymorphus]|uniref:BON domain-containing protein n=1 Tax=Chamaesiphon polymorphus CCALA 037 TaxID=2107692 RepID=A0A2T1GGA8_9CYAN|nr:BON domain-containing protein [Chamaesiphon polymorphus]PSB56675.1 hypothetical protein C7B77_11020 [Chamaesiphon polymorphus CCALA 037]
MFKNQASIIIIGIFLITMNGCQNPKTSNDVSNSPTSDSIESPNSNNRLDDEIASEVKNKLKANIPDSDLRISVDNGDVTVTGTIASSDQIDLGKEQV